MRSSHSPVFWCAFFLIIPGWWAHWQLWFPYNASWSPFHPFEEIASFCLEPAIFPWHATVWAGEDLPWSHSWEQQNSILHPGTHLTGYYCWEKHHLAKWRNESTVLIQANAFYHVCVHSTTCTYVDTCGNIQSCDCGGWGRELRQPPRDRHREPPKGLAFWQTLALTADPAIICHKLRLPEQYLGFVPGS